MPEHEEEVGPSRSKQRVARKDAQSRLESIGERLVALPAKAFKNLELGEAIEEQVHMLATLSSGGALPRQRRRVAGLLRELDLDELEARLEVAEAGSGPGASVTYRLERLRRELLEDETRLSRLFDEHPDLDRQHLGQAVRMARKEASKGTSGRRFRELFQVLKAFGLGEPPPDTEPSSTDDV